MSLQRELLQLISDGKRIWAPADNSNQALEKFNLEARLLIDALDSLVRQGFIGNYRAHVESYTGQRLIDRILITDGLTFKGQNRSTWPL